MVIKLLTVVFLFLVIGLALSTGWIGHLASDDMAYIEAAQAWQDPFPFVPMSHWYVRHPLIIPICISFDLFGSGELQSILPNLMYGAFLLALVFVFCALLFSWGAAVLVSFILILTPLFTEITTVAGPDLVEAFFVFASLSCFLRASAIGGDVAWLFVAGLCAGLAFLTRETAVALIVFYSLSFLVRPVMSRWRYWIMAAGFWVLVGLEMIYYVVVAENAFLRFEIVRGSIELVDPEDPGTGNVVNNRWVGPILALLINNEFGALYWLAGAAAFWFFRHSSTLTELQRRALGCLVGLGLVWFLVVGFALDLRPLPRYFTVVSVAAVCLTGAWLWESVRKRSKHVAVGLVLFLAGTNLIMIDLSNQQYLLPERTLVDLLAADTIRQIHTDPETARRVRILLEWEDLESDQVIARPPPPGEYFLDRGLSHRTEQPPAGFLAAPNWIEVDRSRGRPTVVGQLLLTAGLANLVIDAGLGRLIWEAETVTLYQNPVAETG